MSEVWPDSAGNSLSYQVINTVAKKMGVDPTELPERLFEVIDPDALDALFASGNSVDGVISFNYCDYEVTVVGLGDISVKEPNPEAHHRV